MDLMNMVYTAFAYFAVAGAAWFFLRLVQACFVFPNQMKKRQMNIEQMLEEKVKFYEAYIKDIEEKEDQGIVSEEAKNDPRPLMEIRKERRECLEMLTNELNRIRSGGDPYDIEHLLDDDDEEEEKKKKQEQIQKQIESGEIEEQSADDEKTPLLANNNVNSKEQLNVETDQEEEEDTDAFDNEPKKDK